MNFLHYLLQVNLYLVLLYGCYRLLLYRETFHQINRAYLVMGVALALFLPALQSEWVQSWLVTERLHGVVYTFYDPGLLVVRPVTVAPGMTWGQVVALVYGLGVVVTLGRFSVQAAHLGRLLRGQSLKQESTATGAFSFFNFLFISPELRRQVAIVEHERVHIRQLHSADVLLAEVLVIVCWFNPVVYAYRNALRHLHEFIADEIASRRAASKADYALLLFNQQMGVAGPSFTTGFFNESLLKRRIQMLRQPRSRRAALLKYGLIVPLFSAMLLVSAATVSRHPTLRRIETVLSSDADVLPSPLPASPMPQTEEPTVDLSHALAFSPDLQRVMRADSTDPVFTVVEEPAQFPGGQDALVNYLKTNLRYPDEARKAQVQGKVFLNFLIEKDGSISHINVLKGIGYGCDEEAVRVMSQMPNWVPGKQSGQAVRSRFNLPIAFSLDLAAAQKNEFLTRKPSFYVINGKEVLPENVPGFKGKFVRFRSIPPDEAIELYGERAKNGVEILTISEQPLSFPKLSLTLDGLLQDPPRNVPFKEPLVIFDGKEMSYKDFQNIDSSTIESMSVLKDQSATASYGEKGKNGVIIITTKKH